MKNHLKAKVIAEKESMLAILEQERMKNAIDTALVGRRDYQGQNNGAGEKAQQETKKRAGTFCCQNFPESPSCREKGTGSRTRP